MKEVTDWNEITAFTGMVPVIYTGTTEKQFVIDRLNIANNIDPDNPMGISVYANAEDVMQGIDIVYDSYINEFVLGRGSLSGQTWSHKIYLAHPHLTIKT